MNRHGTPVSDGYSMPPEWGAHAGCFVSWPCKEDTWCGYWNEAKKAYSATINAISEFEPVVVLSDPSTLREAREAVGKRARVMEIPLDDAWIRDNGPIFVTSEEGDTAIVQFGFNGWGERFPPYDRDARVPEVLSERMGLRRYVAPMVLEGGAVCVDGEGTLLTTESCLLNPNRNPGLSREEGMSTVSRSSCRWESSSTPDALCRDCDMQLRDVQATSVRKIPRG